MSRKHGVNKESCKAYKAASRLERNKKRNAKRAEALELHHEQRILKRILAGKSVPSRHLAKYNGKSKGTVVLLGTDVTFAGCDAYASKHGLKGVSERVSSAKLVDKDGNDVTHYSYRLVNVTRRAA